MIDPTTGLDDGTDPVKPKPKPVDRFAALDTPAPDRFAALDAPAPTSDPFAALDTPAPAPHHSIGQSAVAAVGMLEHLATHPWEVPQGMTNDLLGALTPNTLRPAAVLAPRVQTGNVPYAAPADATYVPDPSRTRLDPGAQEKSLLNTLVNAGLIALPEVGLPAKLALGGAVGAYYAPQDRVAGALTGLTLGGVLHGAGKVAAKVRAAPDMPLDTAPADVPIEAPLPDAPIAGSKAKAAPDVPLDAAPEAPSPPEAPIVAAKGTPPDFTSLDGGTPETVATAPDDFAALDQPEKNPTSSPIAPDVPSDAPPVATTPADQFAALDAAPDLPQGVPAAALSPLPPDFRALDASPESAAPPTAPEPTTYQGLPIPDAPDMLHGGVSSELLPAGIPRLSAAVVDGLQKAFAPETRSPEAGETANIIRSANARREQAAVIDDMQLQRFGQTIGKLPMEQQLGIDNAIENGTRIPEHQQAIDAIRLALDTERDKIRDLGTGALDDYYENYLPHLWQDSPARVAEVTAALPDRTPPLVGSPGFLKPGQIQPTQQGMGLGDLLHGDVLEGGKQILSSPLAPFTSYLKGSKVLREYSRPGSVGGPMTAMVDAVIAGGGRIEADFQPRNIVKLRAAMKSGDVVGVAHHLIPATLEAVAIPTMQLYVPRIKLGAFADLAQREIERLPPGASVNEVRSAMGKAWNAVDDRFGQIVYDNLGWNRVMTDLLHASTRSVGWNFGSIRAGIGGALDWKAFATQLAAGKRGVVTNRMEFTMGLPIAVGLLGATYHLLHTGEWPQTLQDYFYPKTGAKDKDGNDERIALPSYMKDVRSWSTHPLQTIANKANPLLDAGIAMLSNKDYWGDEIRNPDDPAMTQLHQALSFGVSQWKPFSVTNTQEQLRRDAGKPSVTEKVVDVVRNSFGLVPAPRAVVRSDAQNTLSEILGKHMPQGRTPEEVATQGVRQDAKQRAARGDWSGVVDAVRQGLTKPSDILKEARQQAKGTPSLVQRFGQLDLASAEKVYKLATPAERTLWHSLLVQKRVRALRP